MKRLFVMNLKILFLGLLVLIFGCTRAANDLPFKENMIAIPEELPEQFSFTRPEHQVGTHFDATSDRFRTPPRLTEIDLPDRPGAHAIWGSTGRDDRGHVYFGVASYGIDNPSAYLLQFNPKDAAVVALGDVNFKLDELGVRKFDAFAETQMKIHGKACQAADGLIYFSSQDEHEERGDGSKNPMFGGRLLRLNPENNKWESLISTPEALIATACAGRYVYALGYFGNVLYQFDTQTSKIISKSIGTFKGHVTRNFIVDKREHAYVPRVRVAADNETSPEISTTAGTRVKSELVELDEMLNEVAAFPLVDYGPTGDTESHGMTAFCHLANGQIAFLSHTGCVSLLTPGDGSGPSQLKRLGWLHPEGKAYAASLFCPTGSRYVYGFASKIGYEWIEYDLETATSQVIGLDETSNQLLKTDGLLVYGCNTLDDECCGYVVGWKKIPRGYGPCAFQIRW